MTTPQRVQKRGGFTAILHGVAIAVAVGTVGLGCRADRAGEPPIGEVAPPVPDDLQADTIARIEGLGAGAAFVVVLDPAEDGWPRLRSTLRDVGHRDAEVVMSSRFDAPVLGVLRAVGVPVRDSELDGWDLRRRTVLALGDPMIDGPPGLPALRLKEPRSVRLRHQIALPALSVEKLMGSLDAALADLEAAPAEIIADAPGAKARVLPREGIVVLLPENTQVRVVVLTHARGREPHRDARAFASDLVPGSGDGQTAALRFAAQPSHAVASLIRPRRLRPLGVMLGMAAAHDAVERIEPDLQRGALAHGLNLVLECERMMGEEPEFRHWAVGLRTGGSTIVSEMMGDSTAHGRGILDAVSQSVATVGVRRDDLVAQGSFVSPFVQNEDSDTTQTVEAFQRCGRFAPLALALASPMRWAAPVIAGKLRGDGGGFAEALAAVLDSRPRSVQLAMTGDSPPRLAFAMTYPSPTGSKKGRETLRAQGAETHVTKRGEQVVLQAGFGVDPREVFDASQKGNGGTLMEGDLDLRSLEIRVPNLPVVSQTQVRIIDGVIVGQATWSTSDKPELRLPHAEKPDVSPRPTTELTPDDRACLRRLLGTVVPALVKMNDPGRRHTHKDPTQWIEAAASDLACLAKGEAREAAAALERHAIGEAATTLSRMGQTAASTILVKTWCDAGKGEEYCEDAAAMSTRPQVVLPFVQLDARCVEKTFPGPGGLAVLVADNQLMIGGERVALKPPAIRDAFERLLPAKRDTALVDVLVDREEKVGTILPTLDALVALGVEMVMVGSMDVESGFVGTGLQLRKGRRSGSTPPSNQQWGDFVTDITVHCELAAIDL